MKHWPAHRSRFSEMLELVPKIQCFWRASVILFSYVANQPSFFHIRLFASKGLSPKYTKRTELIAWNTSNNNLRLRVLREFSGSLFPFETH